MAQCLFVVYARRQVGGLPFWLLGLTVQSSRPAFGGRFTFGVSYHIRDDHMAAYGTDASVSDASLPWPLHGRLAARRWSAILTFVVTGNEIDQRSPRSNAPHLGEEVLLAGSSGAQVQVKAGLLHRW